MGSAAAQMVGELIEGLPLRSTRMELSTELIVRESTAVVPKLRVAREVIRPAVPVNTAPVNTVPVNTVRAEAGTEITDAEITDAETWRDPARPVPERVTNLL